MKCQRCGRELVLVPNYGMGWAWMPVKGDEIPCLPSFEVRGHEPAIRMTPVITSLKGSIMYLHRVIEYSATPTSPGIITHKEWKISTFFHDLSTAVAEEMKLALWVADYDVPGQLALWLQSVMDSPVYTDPLPAPLIITKGGRKLTYRLDHYPLSKP